MSDYVFCDFPYVKSLIEVDIDFCSEKIEAGYCSEDDYVALVYKYKSYANNFLDGLKILIETDRQQTISYNLKLIKSKFEIYNAYGFPQQGNNAPALQINNSNENHNSAIANSVSFSSVRHCIEESESLTSRETGEIICKINELENIINTQSGRKLKWEKASSILKWLADKSVDVAIQVLPLFMKNMKQT